ncbi:hypothetical protein Q1695_003324 [Nippostrongylus brasiliensis]|nr:hypothetical protein Q1695_003324 [Nippostrongylus brasiliensis]
MSTPSFFSFVTFAPSSLHYRTFHIKKGRFYKVDPNLTQKMRCDVHAVLLSLITAVASLPHSHLNERIVDGEDSILSIPPSSSSLGMLDISEQKMAPLQDIEDRVRLDCSVQRKKSLMKKNSGDATIYVPTCSPTNSVNYLAIQCLDVPKYCWCVHTATGEPIPGTSILNARPQCVEEREEEKPKKRPRNRCNGRKRTRFLRRLISAIKTEMIMTGVTSNEHISRDAALKWKFNNLNVNKNQVLERNEWKPYKHSIVQWKKVKYCSRNFFKTCDTVSNGKLTLEEWKKCFASVAQKTAAVRPDQLNPFLYILKAD